MKSKARNKWIRMILVGFVVIGIIGFAGCKKSEPGPSDEGEQAASATEKTATESETAKATETIEQTTCPVMGGPINKDLYVEYKGKKVYFCCPECAEKFKADPEKYVSKLPQFKP